MEQPNGITPTIAKCFLFDAWHLPFLKAQLDSRDEQLAAIAGKAVKEATYHLRHSSEWMVRFGDGTEESHQRAPTGAARPVDIHRGTVRDGRSVHHPAAAGIVPDLGPIEEAFDRTGERGAGGSHLKRPEDEFMATGGRKGQHTGAPGPHARGDAVPPAGASGAQW